MESDRSRYRGYWIERIHSRCWDAYLPAFSGGENNGSRAHGALWSSPAHPTQQAAKAAISAEIRRQNAAVRDAFYAMNLCGKDD